MGEKKFVGSGIFLDEFLELCLVLEAIRRSVDFLEELKHHGQVFKLARKFLEELHLQIRVLVDLKQLT